MQNCGRLDVGYMLNLSSAGQPTKNNAFGITIATKHTKKGCSQSIQNDTTWILPVCNSHHYICNAPSLYTVHTLPSWLHLCVHLPRTQSASTLLTPAI